ncbi:MAG: RtcB family protein [Acidobacteria bacterium]|nr:RtcB family protein [Acidobacteriota bacterium]
MSLETHEGRDLWVLRKGAMSPRDGESGVLPGSMGSPSFHVKGRGHEGSIVLECHGAGRALSRRAGESDWGDLRRQMDGVWYDYRVAENLRDEAPSAYCHTSARRCCTSSA